MPHPDEDLELRFQEMEAFVAEKQAEDRDLLHAKMADLERLMLQVVNMERSCPECGFVPEPPRTEPIEDRPAVGVTLLLPSYPKIGAVPSGMPEAANPGLHPQDLDRKVTVDDSGYAEAEGLTGPEWSKIALDARAYHGTGNSPGAAIALACRDHGVPCFMPDGSEWPEAGR